MNNQNLRINLAQKVDFNNRERQFFTYNEKYYCVRIWQGAESVFITDITNGGKRGKSCPELSISVEYAHRNETPHCLSLLGQESLNTIFEITTAQKDPNGFISKDLFKVIFRTQEAKRMLPVDLNTVKPLKEKPKKWTIPHAIRAIINKQYTELKCKYKYHDDTCEDHGKGVIENNVKFAEKIVENPSGWWISENTDGIVSISCHHFDSNQFKLNI